MKRWGRPENTADENVEAIEDRERQQPRPSPFFLPMMPPQTQRSPDWRPKRPRGVPWRDLPKHDPHAHYFDHGGDVPVYRKADGSPARQAQASRREERRQRFEMWRSQPFSAWSLDPGFFMQLVLYLALLVILLLLIVYVFRHPPARWG